MAREAQDEQLQPSPRIRRRPARQAAIDEASARTVEMTNAAPKQSPRPNFLRRRVRSPIAGPPGCGPEHYRNLPGFLQDRFRRIRGCA